MPTLFILVVLTGCGDAASPSTPDPAAEEPAPQAPKATESSPQERLLALAAKHTGKTCPVVAESVPRAGAIGQFANDRGCDAWLYVVGDAVFEEPRAATVAAMKDVPEADQEARMLAWAVEVVLAFERLEKGERPEEMKNADFHPPKIRRADDGSWLVEAYSREPTGMIEAPPAWNLVKVRYHPETGAFSRD